MADSGAGESDLGARPLLRRHCSNILFDRLKECMIFWPTRLPLGGSHAVRKQSGMWRSGLLVACLAALVMAGTAAPAQAQTNFDRPGGDYLSAIVPSGDPADCALVCERDRHCRAWSFNYPTDFPGGAVCWLKASVPARLKSNCCVSGVRGAGVVEPRDGTVETSIDRSGGDYRSFDLKDGESDEHCMAACSGDNKCRAWTYARPGYVGKAAHCFLKKEIKPPRRRPGFTSGVVR
jgi:hypothetical protein